MENSLQGKTALITGGSRGIGLAIARKLGQMGASIAISGRSQKSLDAAVTELSGAGVKALAISADVSIAKQVADMVQRTNAAFGDIHILVNNAGVGIFGPAHEQSEENWDTVIDTNLKGVFLCSKAVAPQMIRQKTGHIINISSLAGKNANAGGGIYYASKWGLQGLTFCMAEDLRQYGIRVSAICPGSVHTEFSPHVGKDPLKMLLPDDVAHAVAMLVTQAPQSFISEVLLRPTMQP